MDQSADWENEEPASDCKKASFKRKKTRNGHYLKIAPLMCCEQRAVSLKGPNSFYFRVLYLQQDYKQDPQQTLRTEHALVKNSETHFPFPIFSRCFLVCLPNIFTINVQSPPGLTSKSKIGWRQAASCLSFMVFIEFLVPQNPLQGST